MTLKLCMCWYARYELAFSRFWMLLPFQLAIPENRFGICVDSVYRVSSNIQRQYHHAHIYPVTDMLRVLPYNSLLFFNLRSSPFCLKPLLLLPIAY